MHTRSSRKAGKAKQKSTIVLMTDQFTTDVHSMLTTEARPMLLQLSGVSIFDQPLHASYFYIQSYIPSCSQMSTRKSTISCHDCDRWMIILTVLYLEKRRGGKKFMEVELTERGIGWGNGLLLPSKLSYVAFQLQSQNFLTRQRQWVLTK